MSPQFAKKGGKKKHLNRLARMKGKSQPVENKMKEYEVGDLARILGTPNTDNVKTPLDILSDPVNIENGNNDEFTLSSPRNNKTKKQKRNMNKEQSLSEDTAAIESSGAKTPKGKKKKVLGTPESIESKILIGKKPKGLKTPEPIETKKLKGKMPKVLGKFKSIEGKKAKRKKLKISETIVAETLKGVTAEVLEPSESDQAESPKGKKRKLLEPPDSIQTIILKKFKKSIKVERQRNESVEDEKKRTLFVGNFPNTCTRKEIKDMFKKFGEIDTVRFRSAAVPDIKTSKKVAIIKQEFHPDRHNLNAYVRFKDEESVKNALQANGMVVDGFHLRVDSCTSGIWYDKKRSVFLGNMPYNIEEETVYKYFAECGEIVGVRIVRDSKTGVGKGFGYVNFKSVDSVNLALRFNDKVLGGRQVRVKRCVDNEKPVIKKKFGAPGFKGAAGQHLKRPFQGSTSAGLKNKKPYPKMKWNDKKGKFPGKQNNRGNFSGKQNNGGNFDGKQNKGKFAGKKFKK